MAGGGTLAASPGARSAVLEWLGLKSVKIERTEPRIGASLDLGPAIELPKGTRVPEALRDPEAYDTRLPDGTKTVSLVYKGPILVQVFRARATPFIQKTLGQGSKAERRPGRLLDHGVTRIRVRVRERVRIRTAAARGQDPADRA